MMIHSESKTILPIHSYLPKIDALLSEQNNLVLQAEPGAGKSTALPLSLLNAQWLHGKKILMLEPRRIAAKSIAHYLARQLNEPVGQRVGYQIKNERKTSENTVLEIVTEGILTQRLQNDPEISNIGLIIFDEFHERSLHADLALLLALEIQQTIREDIKILVMSATIDTKMMSEYMGGASIIKCPGTMYPVELEYTPHNKTPLSSKVSKALLSVIQKNIPGDILIFLPGRSEIHKAIAKAKQVISDSNIQLLPLYGGLSLTEQEKVLQTHNNEKRRIIFSTNIAETSLTIEGITCVIDSGLEKVMLFDSSSAMTRLETNYISKASANQRMGRAGRTQKGMCIRLWDENRQRSLKDYQDEEVLSSDLSAFVLELAKWGTAAYDDINWLSAPPKANFNSAWDTLSNLKLVDKDKKISELGLKATGIGLPPRLATMLLQASGSEEISIACDLAALLSERDIFLHNNRIDIIDRLIAIHDYNKDRIKALQSYPLNRAAIEQQQKSAQQLKKKFDVKKSTQLTSLSIIRKATQRLLLYAYPDRLAKRRSNHCSRYQLANGKGVILPEGDSLFGSDWLIVTDCDGQKSEGRIYNAAPASYESILDTLSPVLTKEIRYDYDKDKEIISGFTYTKYQHLDIDKKPIAVTPEMFQNCLKKILPQIGLNALNWTESCKSWLSRVTWLNQQLPDFPDRSEKTLIETVDTWLIPYLSKTKKMSELKKINILPLLTNSLPWADQKTLESEAPTHYTAPSGKAVPIRYSEHQEPTVAIQLQEMFGQTTSPKISKNQTPIRFELLSPAKRPIQTTSDLHNFWRTSYLEVAKEMRGKYPKHRWPEKPLDEKAGKSIKHYTK